MSKRKVVLISTFELGSWKKYPDWTIFTRLNVFLRPTMEMSPLRTPLIFKLEWYAAYISYVSQWRYTDWFQKSLHNSQCGIFVCFSLFFFSSGTFHKSIKIVIVSSKVWTQRISTSCRAFEEIGRTPKLWRNIWGHPVWWYKDSA